MMLRVQLGVYQAVVKTLNCINKSWHEMENVVTFNICIPCFGAGYFLFYFDSLLYFEFNFLVSLFLICPCNISINKSPTSNKSFTFCLYLDPNPACHTALHGGVWVCLRDFPPSLFLSFTACSQRKLYFHISVKIGGVVIVENFFLHTLLFAL